MIALKVMFAKKPVNSSLMIVEMAIYQQLDLEGQNYYGKIFLLKQTRVILTFDGCFSNLNEAVILMPTN